MKLCILIPVFNGDKTIKALIEKIRVFTDDIIVVDDGSTDNTAMIAKESKVIIISHSKNKGKGESLKSGFGYILKNTDFKYVIVMDADAQHDPRFIPDFLKAVHQKGADIVIGNRMEYTHDMPAMRRLTNKTMSFIISKVTKQDIPDSQCGYRLLKRKVLERVKIETSKYDMESEILFKAAKQHFKIDSVKISTVYTDQKSNIKPLIDTLRFIRLLINFVLKK